jgi:hypothetical protein
MGIDFTGLINLFIYVITHPVGAYRFTRDILKWLDTNKFNKFNLVDNYS